MQTAVRPAACLHGARATVATALHALVVSSRPLFAGQSGQAIVYAVQNHCALPPRATCMAHNMPAARRHGSCNVTCVVIIPRCHSTRDRWMYPAAKKCLAHTLLHVVMIDTATAEPPTRHELTGHASTASVTRHATSKERADLRTLGNTNGNYDNSRHTQQNVSRAEALRGASQPTGNWGVHTCTHLQPVPLRQAMSSGAVATLPDPKNRLLQS
jgi:hypothetical protein